MKKIFTLMLALLAVSRAEAVDVETFTYTYTDNDGEEQSINFYYVINDDGESITITNSTGSTGATAQTGYSEYFTIIIPEEVEIEIEETKTTYKVSALGDYVFNLNDNITYIEIPTSVTSIGINAFCQTYITSIVIPEGVTELKTYTCNLCYYLTDVTLPETLTSIGDGAFRYCSSLGKITIPKNITYIDKEAFYTEYYSKSSSLSSVTIEAINPPELGESDVFVEYTDADGENSKPSLYVPNGCYNLYSRDSSWYSYFGDNIIGFPIVVDDGEYYFYYIDEENQELALELAGVVNGATSLTIPASIEVDGTEYEVRSIASDVFADYSELTLTVSSYISFDVETASFDDDFKGILICKDTDVRAEYIEAGWHEYFLIYGYVKVGDTFVVDNIKYEITNITDLYEVQVIGTTATEEDTIEFVAEVDFNTFTFDVLNIADNAFDGQTALMAEINIIDPELITLGEIADVSEGKIGKLTVYPGTVNIYNESDWATYFEIAGNEYLEVDSVYYVFKISSNKASSSKNTITLEVDHVDENATEVTIPRTIDLGDDSSTSYEVTSMNADALKDCKDLITINLEASIPAEDIEALNKVPDSVTIVLDEEELGAEYCESVKAAAAIAGIEVKMVSTAIVEVKVATEKVEVERYNLLGQKVSAPQRGINIVKYSDGTVEKVLVK